LLFSATTLSNEELQFYCGIEPSLIQRAMPVSPAPSLAQTSSLYLSTRDQLNASQKLRIVRRLLRETRVRTLILVNNANHVKELARHLGKKRLVAATGPHMQRMKDFRQFMARKTAILLTSSSVFWEGITIKGVRLLIISEPPFPRPPLLDLHRKQVTDGRPEIERRLEQGVGRIARRPEDKAVCILLFSVGKLLPRPSMYFTKRNLFKELPARIIVQRAVEYLRT
jgi:Rad3-related DNA helicase